MRITILFVLFAAFVFLTSCSFELSSGNKQATTSTFQAVETGNLDGNYYVIIRDTQTGDEYIVVHVYSGTAMSKIRQASR